MGNQVSKEDVQPSDGVAKLQARWAKMDEDEAKRLAEAKTATSTDLYASASKSAWSGSAVPPLTFAAEGHEQAAKQSLSRLCSEPTRSVNHSSMAFHNTAENAGLIQKAPEKQNGLVEKQNVEPPRPVQHHKQAERRYRTRELGDSTADITHEDGGIKGSNALVGGKPRMDRRPSRANSLEVQRRESSLRRADPASTDNVWRTTTVSDGQNTTRQVEEGVRDAQKQAGRGKAEPTMAVGSTETVEGAIERQSLKRHAPAGNSESCDLSGMTTNKRARSENPTDDIPHSPVAIEEREPPMWYQNHKVTNKRIAGTSNADTLLQRLKDQITKLKRNGPHNSNPREMNELREILHEAPFLAMGDAGPQLLRNKRILHNNDGLPQIFDDRYAQGMAKHWPWDVKSDAMELYHKWCSKNFEDDMLHGLVLATKKSKHAEGDRAADQVDKGYQISSKYVGNGKLVNGQWWPTLLCALRDGAHGDSQAGISGETGVAAYSCLMSGGKGHIYPDHDSGDIVEYYGQDSTNPGQISRGTALLLKNQESKVPVRFIRSSKAASHSRYAPSIGFRYDGLYDVVESKLTDESNMRYRFKLVRRPDQGPIRGGDGPEARPTEQEVLRFKQDKRFRGF